MIVFINDIPLHIINQKKVDESKFDKVYKGNKTRLSEGTKGKILFKKISLNFIDHIVAELRLGSYDKLKSVHLSMPYKSSAKKHLKKLFKTSEAAGGLVTNTKGDILLIHRLKKWDLPKGKIEAAEKEKLAALREVEEECNIKVRLKRKITKTWHTYAHKDKRVLKCNHWYLMECQDDSNLKPQKSEGIDKVEWMSFEKAKKSLDKSYPSLRIVLEKYLHLTQNHK